MRREPFLFSAIFASSAVGLCCVAAVAKSRLHANVPNVIADKHLRDYRWVDQPIIGVSAERPGASHPPRVRSPRSESVVKNSPLWRVVDNESGTQSIVSTPSEAVAFVNSRFDTNDDDEPFSITEVGPLLPKPLGIITAWAAKKDGERTDGRTAPITIRPVVTDNAIECDDVVL